LEHGIMSSVKKEGESKLVKHLGGKRKQEQQATSNKQHVRHGCQAHQQQQQ